jgi:hypothetical protein
MVSTFRRFNCRQRKSTNELQRILGSGVCSRRLGENRLLDLDV